MCRIDIQMSFILRSLNKCQLDYLQISEPFPHIMVHEDHFIWLQKRIESRLVTFDRCFALVLPSKISLSNWSIPQTRGSTFNVSLPKNVHSDGHNDSHWKGSGLALEYLFNTCCFIAEIDIGRELCPRCEPMLHDHINFDCITLY